MALKKIHARAVRGSEQVDALLEKARTQAGVERILVVYEQETAHIYVEGEQLRARPTQVRAS